MKKIASIFFFGLVALFVYLSPSPALAGTEHNMAGYAWSSNIGWVSLNCTNDSTCGGVDYGVNMNNDGSLVGYAWSPTVGWIQFGGLSGFPTGGGTQSINATTTGSNVTGWIRAVGADNNGWDGWISMSGTSPNYGVTYSGGTFSGFAWGSTNVGWLSFNCANDSSCLTSSYSVALSASAAIDVKSGGLSIVGQGAVPYGTVPTFFWTMTNMPSGSCSITKTVGGSPFSTPITGKTVSGSQVEDALTVAGLHTYALNCTNPTISISPSFTVAVQPASFNIGGNDTVGIQFLNAGSATSQVDTTFVNAFGGFNNPVSVSITGFPTPPASTTYAYSLAGSGFVANPSAAIINSPYGAGATFQVQVTRVTGAPAFTNPFVVTLTGSASGYSSVTKTVTINPTTSVQGYQEF